MLVKNIFYQHFQNEKTMSLENYLCSLKKPEDVLSLSSEPYNLTVSHHVDTDGSGVYVLDYNQITSPRFDTLVDRCRGIVLDDKTLKIVCNTYKRFYNAGEDPLTHTFNFVNSVSFEKVDGSLIKVYFYNGLWRIGTRGTAFANNTLTTFTGEEGKITFKDLFLKTLNITYEKFQDTMNKFCDKTNTYIFELCTMENRVVTHYESDRVYLTGCINNIECTDASVMDLHNIYDTLNTQFHSFYLPHYTEHDSLESVINHAESLNDLKEGFVLCENALCEDDLPFKFRLKIKSKAYLYAHRIRGNGITPKRIFDLVFSNEHVEFLIYYPEYQKFFDTYIEKYDNIKQQILNVFAEIRNIDDKKAYALEATKYDFSAFLFTMKQKNLTLEQCLENVNINQMYRLMGIS